jgi:alpha-tubulin suppressor-like RCC1 family protein
VQLVTIPTEEKIIKVCCGGNFSTALTNKGALYVWGDNYCGQLGLGDETARSTPTLVPGLPPATDLACGWFHVLYLTCDGSLYSWGRNEDGKLGVGTFKDFNSPCLTSIKGVTRVFAAAHHSFALTQDGCLWGWGWNSHGNLGLGEGGDRASPVRVLLPGTQAWKDITAAKAAEGEAGAEGGEAKEEGEKELLDLACGWGHSLALFDDGTVYTWGYNMCGELGFGDGADRNLPTKLEFKKLPGEKMVFVGGGNSHSFVISENGTMLIWGLGNSGQLGVGDSRNHSSPKLLPNLKWKLPPNSKKENWERIFLWLFMGNRDEESTFRIFPIEVVFYMVGIFFK